MWLLRFSQKPQRFLQFLHALIDDGTSKCPLNYPHGAEHEIRLVEIWIPAAFGRTILIDATKVIFQERAGGSTGLPGVLVARSERSRDVSINC
jgi:hypothetical protein